MVHLPVDEPEVHLNLIRRDTTAIEKVDDQLLGILDGLATLLNQFLREAGISDVHVADCSLVALRA